MAIWYVSYATGTDDTTANRGTAATNPFKTINFISSRTTAPLLAAGDTVYVAPGVYVGTNTVAVSGAKGSTIKYIADTSGYYTSTNPGPVVLTGFVNLAVATTYGFNLASRSYIYLEGFTFQGFSASGVFLSTTNHVEITKCKFDSVMAGISTAAADGSGVGRTSIHDCEFTNCYYGMRMYSLNITYAAETGDLPYWNSALSNYWANNVYTGCAYGIYVSYNSTATYSNNLLIMGNAFSCSIQALYLQYISSTTDSNNGGFFRNIVKPANGTSYPSYLGTTNGSLLMTGNVLVNPTQYLTSVMYSLFGSSATNSAPAAGSNHVGLPPDAWTFNGDGAAYNSLATYGSSGLYLEKTAPIQGTASGKLYGYVQNKYKWRIPADLNQSLGVMLSAQRSWASGLGGNVTFRLYDEAGILTPTTATLQDDNFLHTVTVANITMPYKGFAILEVEIVPRTSGAALGDNCLIDDIQII